MEGILRGKVEPTKEPCNKLGPDPPIGRDNFQGEGHARRHVSCTKASEPIERPFANHGTVSAFGVNPYRS